MSGRELIGEFEDEPKPGKAPDRSGSVGVVQVNRHRATVRPEMLDDLLPEDHCARDPWTLVGRLHLSSFYERIEARGSFPGRDAIDPKILLAPGVYAHNPLTSPGASPAGRHALT